MGGLSGRIRPRLPAFPHGSRAALSLSVGTRQTREVGAVAKEWREHPPCDWWPRQPTHGEPTRKPAGATAPAPGALTTTNSWMQPIPTSAKGRQGICIVQAPHGRQAARALTAVRPRLYPLPAILLAEHRSNRQSIRGANPVNAFNAPATSSRYHATSGDILGTPRGHDDSSGTSGRSGENPCGFSCSARQSLLSRLLNPLKLLLSSVVNSMTASPSSVLRRLSPLYRHPVPVKPQGH